MKEYIGTKMIQAEPEKGLYRPYDQELTEGYRVVYPDGYVSWSPKDVFEAAYRPTDGMNFGLAIEAAKMGKRIARAGWNGKGMYVFLAKEIEFTTEADLSEFDDKDVVVGDVLVMRTANGIFQPGWLASQADMLADDWYIVESAADHGTAEAELNKIYGICIQVTKITDAEVQELRELAQGQMEYHNPLKMATTASENARGRHNQAVLDALLNLKAVIESGESI